MEIDQGRLDFGRTVKVPVIVKKGAAATPKYGNGGFSSYKKRLYEPGAEVPFSLSRSKVDMFLKCSRCFYLEQRLGIKIPSGPGFSLNNAVDHLLKKEFDIRRAAGVSHPLMDAYGIDAVPAQHAELEIWRSNHSLGYFRRQGTNRRGLELGKRV